MTRTIPAMGAGIGLRLPHLGAVLRERPAIGWLEVHPENFLANPQAADMLAEIARHYPISLHSVGVSVGSADGIDRHHLQRIAAMADALDPVMISGHLAWSTHAGDYLNDLLPLPYHKESLAIVCDHIAAVQNALGRPYHLENPSTYLGFADSTMTETAFLSAVVARTGCRLLCDVSNVHVSAHNLGYDAYRYIDEFPGDAIGEMHLGGFAIETESDGGTVIVDTHDQPVDDAAWALYAYAIRRHGPRPTLIEWDNGLPALDTLIAEARRADRVANGAMAEAAHGQPR